jgi:hypothetical protein
VPVRHYTMPHDGSEGHLTLIRHLEQSPVATPRCPTSKPKWCVIEHCQGLP